MNSQQFNCDHLRCRKAATWHGRSTSSAESFEGRSHFCELHRPDAPSERVYVPGESGLFKRHDGMEFGERKRR